MRGGNPADRGYPTRSRRCAVLGRPIQRRDRATVGVFSAFKSSKLHRTAYRQSHRRRSAHGRRNIESLPPISTKASNPRLGRTHTLPCAIIRVAHRSASRGRLPCRCTKQKMSSPGVLMKSDGQRRAGCTRVEHSCHTAAYVSKVGWTTTSPAAHRQRETLAGGGAHAVAGSEGERVCPSRPRGRYPAQCSRSVRGILERHAARQCTRFAQ